MFDIIEKVITGRWFQAPSPFHCSLTKGHDKICIITGPNACGKSVLRKILHNVYKDAGMDYVHISQEGRSSSTGLQRAVVYGSEQDDSTGYHSVRMLLKAIQSAQSYTTPFGIMLDEPEIGCSEEVQASLALRMMRDCPMIPHLHGWFVITHSRELVRHLLPLNPTHWRLCEDGMSLEQFVTRPVVPADLESVLQLNKDRWREVQGLINSKKQGG